MNLPSLKLEVPMSRTLRFVSAFCFLFFLLAGTKPAAAFNAGTSGICAVDGNGASSANMSCPVAPYAYGDQSTFIGMYGEPGARLNAGVNPITAIYKFNICRYVYNHSGRDYFIPLKSNTEWTSFLNSTQSAPVNADISTYHCAFPWLIGGLVYGPTTKRDDMNDGGDAATYPAPALPYWRTGDHWPRGANPTHTFNHSCYQEYWQYKCWSGHWHDYTTCDPDICNTSCNTVCFPVCPFPGICFPVCGDVCSTSCSPGPCHDHHDWICDDNGSTCEKDWHNWSETFDFSATALDGEVNNPSWISYSRRVAGTTRPDSQCTRRCTFTGHDCLNCNAPAQANDPATGAYCQIPDQVMFDSYAMFYCSAHPQELTTCAAMALVVLNYENQINATSDQCEKMRLRIQENNDVSNVNAIAYGLFIAYGGK